MMMPDVLSDLTNDGVQTGERNGLVLFALGRVTAGVIFANEYDITYAHPTGHVLPFNQSCRVSFVREERTMKRMCHNMKLESTPANSLTLKL